MDRPPGSDAGNHIRPKEQRRAMNRFAERYGTVVLIAIAAGILIYAGAFAPVGLKLIDEVIYNAAAVSFADRGALIVENGWDRFGADALRINFLVPGPHGLASQYPPGAAVLGAPLQRLFGLQGLILLNALAAMATLFVTRAVARSAFGREDVALSAVLLLVLASFWVEYAFGIWPHSLGTLMVLIAFWAGLRGLAADPAAALRWAVLAGSVAGAGLLIRADTVLIVPALAAAAILFAPRPWSMIGAGLAGLAPFVALASWVNHYKFDRWNPLTYGLDKPGGVELSGHVPVILLVAGVFLCLAVARGLRWQPGRGPWILLACAAAALALLVPPVRALFIAYGQGFFGLVVDAKPLPNFEPTEWNGVVYFWELPKKALGQNMPWIGCLLGAVFLPLTARERRVLILCALAAFVWTLPFILRSWHGNYGANMRYFLPLLPLLAVVGAWLWHRLADMTGAGGLVLGLGAIYAGGLAALWSVLHASGFDGAQQIMSTHVLTASAGIALAAGWGARRVPRLAIGTQFMFAIGVGLALLFAVQDIRYDRTNRQGTAIAAATFAGLPPRSVYYGRPELFPSFFARPDSHLAMPYAYRRDAAFLSEALDKGYRVYVEPEHLQQMLTLIPGSMPGPYQVSGYYLFHELLPPPRPAPDSPPPATDE
jgi:4-amino-4-deoxy-L-arabinose transferase-like glycosyltransferase